MGTRVDHLGEKRDQFASLCTRYLCGKEQVAIYLDIYVCVSVTVVVFSGESVPVGIIGKPTVYKASLLYLLCAALGFT